MSSIFCTTEDIDYAAAAGGSTINDEDDNENHKNDNPKLW
jgi:hypothetical protein